MKLFFGGYIELLFGVPALPICRHARGRDGHADTDCGREKTRRELPEHAACSPDTLHFHCIALGLRDDSQKTICRGELENVHGFDPRLLPTWETHSRHKNIAPCQNRDAKRRIPPAMLKLTL